MKVGKGFRYGRAPAARETVQILRARRARPEVVQAVRALHFEWLLDSEIGERLGLSRVVVWHIRQFHHINRHRP